MIQGLQTCGVRFAVEVDAGRWKDLQPYLPPNLVAADPAGARRYRFEAASARRWRAFLDDEPLCGPTWFRHAAHAVERDLGEFLADRAVDRILVHAGVIGWRGRAMVFPANSQYGKSTLVEYLVRQGAEYYSDEYAAIDSRGQVHPWPRWLSLRETPSRSRRVRPMRVGREPLPIGLVLSTRYQAGTTFEPETVPPGPAVLDLLSHTVAARTRPQEALHALREAVTGALVWRGARGDAADLAPRLFNLWT